MSRKLSTQEFIEKAQKIHGDKYDYSNVYYVDAWVPVKIICKKHNLEFQMSPHNHLRGQGCPLCGNERKGQYRKVSLDDFIRRANEKHGNKYDYSLVDLKNTWSKVDIICPIHGVFSQKANDHLRGIGCPECGKKFGISEKQVLAALEEKYGTVEYQKPFSFLKSKTSSQTIDIFLPKFSIGVEYQGDQHFHSKTRFGGDIGYEKTKERDFRKFQKCEANGIKMFYISFEKNIPTDYFAPVYTSLDSLFTAIDEYISQKQSGEPINLSEGDIKRIINNILKQL